MDYQIREASMIDWPTVAIVGAILIPLLKCAWLLRGIKEEAKVGSLAAREAAADIKDVKNDFHDLKGVVIRHDCELKEAHKEIQAIKKKLPPSNKYSVQT